MTQVATDWDAVREGIRLWIAGLSGVNALGNPVPVYWRDDNVPHGSPEDPTRVLLAMPTIEHLGVSNIDYEGSGSGTERIAIPRQDQLARATLDVSVQTGFGGFAQTILMRIMAKTEIDELRTPLTPCTGVVSTGPVSETDFDYEGYNYSQATSTWVLTVRDTFQDSDVFSSTINSVVGKVANASVIPDIDL